MTTYGDIRRCAYCGRAYVDVGDTRAVYCNKAHQKRARLKRKKARGAWLAEFNDGEEMTA